MDLDRVVVYGSSDDNVDVCGALSEEFGCYDAEGVYLFFSEGTVIRMAYVNPGIWEARIHKHGLAKVNVLEVRDPNDEVGGGNDEDGCPPYSDKVVLEGKFYWVAMARKENTMWAFKKGWKTKDD